jgi:hypothetical protein
MTAKVTFFPVGNGDMTLLDTHEGRKILIDCRIRGGDEYPDVLTELRDRLDRDAEGRLYVDLFVWSHPDEDHCQGIKEYFHLGKPEDWSKKKDLIFINEIWSSPIVWKRADRAKHKLTDDARALNAEVKRRVNNYKVNKQFDIGNYVLVLGNDEDGKTDAIQDIVLQLDQITSTINGSEDNSFSARLLGPTALSELDEEEEKLGKNHSSVIMNYKLICGGKEANFLSGGDAEVACWESLITRLKDSNCKGYLKYNILQAPHHCSWHTLSYDSLSKKGNDATPSDDALDALGQARDNAFIISSSDSIADDDNDPPAYRAKQEYLKILDDPSGDFKCVADHKKNGKNIPLTIEISDQEIKLIPAAGIATSTSATKSAVNRRGSDGYA